MQQKHQNEERISLARGIQVGLLLVVPMRMYGHNSKALTDKGATRCFFTPTSMTACEQKAEPRHVFLELGN